MRSVRMTDIAVILISAAALLINTSIGILRIVGYGCVILSLIMFVVQHFMPGGVVINPNLLLAFLPIIIIYTVGFVRNLSTVSIKEWALLLLTISMVISASNYANQIAQFQNRYMKLWFPCIILILILTMRFSWAYNPIDNGFKGIYSTTTFLGIFCVLLIEICLLNYRKDHLRRWLVFVVPLAYFIYRTRVRTAYIGVISVVLVSCLLICGMKKRNNRTLQFIRLIRFFTYAVIVGFIIIYPILDSFKFYDYLSDIVFQYTGKMLMTGRQNIWASALDLIRQRPLFGYGLANETVNSSGVHNSYLSILLQTGILGIVSLFLVVNSILKKSEKKNTVISGQIQSYTCINLIMCLTEVMLLQGQIILQVIIWLILAIGLGYNDKNNMSLYS